MQENATGRTNAPQTCQHLPEPLNALTQAYSKSKQFRLGAAYIDTDPAFREELAQETGLRLQTLQRYASLNRNYMRLEPNLKRRWTDEEDNLIMAHYQTSTLKKLMKLIKQRSFSTIKNRASYLGVSKPKTKIR